MSPNDRIAHYEILEKIGEGGMGEVFRARDTRLGRIAALKFLPEAFAADPERLARFQREAQVLASLHHPNISAVYGLEEDDSRQVLAMEFVDGEDLSTRIATGPVPLDEAMDLARQIAEGLEAAHEAGVVHRDLKPANIRVTPDHDVKILDFGLARIDPSSTDSSSVELSQSPTLTGMLTSANVILGTAAYMSPEQARGRPLDKRSDIWSFGAVLYETLTGVQAFSGESVSDILAAVLKTEPDFEFLPKGTPPALVDLLRRCLEKDARKRLRDIGEARILLSGDMPSAAAAPTVEPVTATNRNRLLGLLVSLVLLLIPILAILVFTVGRSGGGRTETTYVDLVPPPESPFFTHGSGAALSPDGRRVLFSLADSLGGSRLYVRDLAAAVTTAIPRSETAQFPLWSPDGRQIAYSIIRDGGRVLERRDLASNAIYLVTTVGSFRGGDWYADDTILYAGDSNAHLSLVSVAGGEPRPVTSLRRGDISHRFPVRLPDGDGFLFSSLGTDTVERGSLADSTVREVVITGMTNLAVAGDHLFYVRDQRLLARNMDGHGSLLGDPFAVGPMLPAPRSYAYSGFHAVAGGTVIWYGGGGDEAADSGHGLTILGSDGALEFSLDSGSDLDDINMSADGRYAAVTRYNGSIDGSNVWVFDMERRIFTRESDRGFTDDPAWGPAGRLVYSHKGNLYLHEQGASDQTLLHEDAHDKITTDWSTDGRFVVYVTGSDKEDLWYFDTRSGEPHPLVQGASRQIHGQLSPDNQWLAYTSDESGELHVYVQDFPGMTRRCQVSRTSSAQPRWMGDGGSLVYLDRNMVLHEANLSFSGTQAEVVGETELFRLENPSGGYNIRTHQWDMTPDGRRIVYFTSSGEQLKAEPLHLLLNWRPEE